MIRQLRDRVMARVTDSGTVSEVFAATNGVKQACVFASALFRHMFSAMLMDAYRDKRPEIRIVYRTGGHLNRRCMQAPTRLSTNRYSRTIVRSARTYIQQEIGIPTNTLKELLLRCTLNVQFLFDNQLYRQVDGVAMGSPLGPLLADVFMGKLERFQLSEQIDQLKHYGRYVDDIFAIATAETDVATLLDAANQAHPSIKFTLEMETASLLPFLDVLLSRRPDGSVRRSVYRKKTWSGQYTNFASFVPLQQKRNLVRCLAQRARKICSTDSIEEELRKIQDFLRENEYPERFIEKNIAERPIKPATPTAEKKTLFLKVPFQGDAASELLRRRLDQAVSRTFPAARVQIAFSTNPILRGEGKDKLPPQTTSMCIYSFTCSCGAGYIGRTSRRLSKRIREHLPAWLAKGETRRIDSAILAHVVDSGHRVDPDEAFRVIYKVPSSYPKLLGQRLLATAEAAAIRLRKPILCAQKNHVQAPRLQWSKVE
ncbi:hypothetical protein SprV_0501917100 [Sparganum proliferum]